MATRYVNVIFNQKPKRTCYVKVSTMETKILNILMIIFSINPVQNVPEEVYKGIGTLSLPSRVGSQSVYKASQNVLNRVNSQ